MEKNTIHENSIYKKNLFRGKFSLKFLRKLEKG